MRTRSPHRRSLAVVKRHGIAMWPASAYFGMNRSGGSVSRNHPGHWRRVGGFGRTPSRLAGLATLAALGGIRG